MEVAVAVLAYNNLNHLMRYLPDLISCSQNARVVVIDNGSTDGSVEWIREHCPAVDVIELGNNFGFADGYNRGLKQIKSDVYLLINSDVRVNKGWLEPLTNWLEKEPGIAAVQPKILSDRQPDRFEYAGAAGGFVDWLGYPFCRGRILETLEIDLGQYDSVTEVHWTSGACMAVRARAFEESGGFDPVFFAHQEEIDLCWRLRKLGYKLICEPKSVVYHLGGGTLSYHSPRKTFLNFRNNLLMLSKNMDFPRVIFVIFIRLILDGIAGIKFLIEGKVLHSWMIVKAHFSFYRLIPKVVKYRRFRSTTKLNSVKLWPRSILSEYFLKRKRTFSQLPA
ncbi:glycosyltransferase family 2 protein [Schleiferia thermophila]|jgi:GT2 family glycosyltransferase|uniref:Glycosyltransferase 2-like domain-containing protein n=1 Tax=Schleiferia thermophila TaxID=884107 RepID=A0A369A366_9FLAO|nr:glycosyltransferase family 2 protein [Schleiferia thermophila]PMB38029.1 dTDP-Rha--alpha-D-GlcNAc-pyrophosphate polyprenol alpha-3-L-rhamnosyltransferase [Fischerella thermalis CCMEE 5319]RCX01914.1 hypothetical protein DES35_10613 [Schleiferia thermophila]GCD79778.1 glycosyl transferase family 2 [Schleiferia thermophila]